MKKIIKNNKLINIIKLSWQEFCAAGGFEKTGSLAYVTILSIVPLLTVIFSILSSFPAFKSISTKVQALIFTHLVAESAKTVEQYLQLFVNQTNQLSVFGVVFLVLAAVILVFSMEHTFNALWRVKQNRHGVTAFLLYWAVITLMPIFGGAILWSAIYFPSVALVAELYVVKILIPYVITFFFITVLYITLPNRKIPLKSAGVAAFIATVLLEIARRGFAIYIAKIATYKIIYGAIAALPIFLLWLYISWLVILFGVVVNAVMVNNHNHR